MTKKTTLLRTTLLRTTLLRTLAILAALSGIPLAAASASANAPQIAPLALRSTHLAVEVRAEHECMAAAQRRMEQRHHRWEDEARVAGLDSDAHFTLQLEHENVLDQHRALVERHEWLLVREADVRRTLRRRGTRLTAAQRVHGERALALLQEEERDLEAAHNRLLRQHERLSLQHDQLLGHGAVASR